MSLRPLPGRPFEAWALAESRASSPAFVLPSNTNPSSSHRLSHSMQTKPATLTEKPEQILTRERVFFPHVLFSSKMFISSFGLYLICGFKLD